MVPWAVEPRGLPLRPTCMRTVRLAPVLAGLLLVPGCGGDVVTAGDTTVLVGQRATSGMDALGGGTLEVVGGCLGAGGYVVVWPHGTEVVDEDPLTIDIPDAGRVALGDEVQVGGGFVLEHSSTTRSPGPLQAGGITVPAECAAYDVFLAAG